MKQPADHENREAARTRFGSPVVLQAGAGTGKTAVLVARILTWILGPGWKLHEKSGDREDIAISVLERVLALTFTEKAAGQMATKVAEALENVSTENDVTGLPLSSLDAPRSALAKRAGILLVHLDRLNITTIHGWCRRLLSSYPVEASLHPEFVVDADGSRRRGVIDEVVAEWVGRAFSEPADPDAVQLAAAGYDPIQVHEALSELAQEGARPKDLDPGIVSEERFADARSELEEALAPLLPVAETLLASKGKLDVAQRAARFLQDAAAQTEQAHTLDDLAAAFGNIPYGVPERLRKWAKGDFLDSEKKVLTEPASIAGNTLTLLPLVGTWGQAEPELLKRLLRILHGLVTDIRERLVARGIVGFSDLLVEAERLLSDHAVATRVRTGLDQLLVDEFQDTDARQYQILEHLALTQEEPRPGLFLVGDPKQSIYGWRQADLRAYDAFKARLRQRFDTEPLELWVNFRSVPAILDEVANVIEPVMEPREGIQPAFQRLQAGPERAEHPGFCKAGRRPVEQWVSWSRQGSKVGPKTPTTRARELEAQAIAGDIRELVNGDHGLRFRDFAILFRTRTSLDIYLAELKDAGIPFLVEGGRNFYRRREIRDATSLVRCVLDPTDHLALLGFLRSPTVGLPDAALVPLWERHFPDRMTSLTGPDAEQLRELFDMVDAATGALPEDVPGLAAIRGFGATLKDAILAIARLRESFAEDPADRFVECLRHLAPMETTEAARYLGEHRAANLDRFFRNVLDTLVNGEGGPDAVLRELNAAVEDVRPEQDAAVGTTEVDAVRIMTVHMAKGLDFTHVYVPDLHRGDPGETTGHSRTAHLSDGSRELIILGLPSPGWHRVRAREAEVRRAESIRLLYVAITRPKDRLVMIGRWPEPGRLRPPEDARELIDLVAHRGHDTDDVVRTLAQDLATAPAEMTDATNARWRLLDPVSPPLKAPETDDSHPFDATEVADRLLRLEASRERARARMDLPLVAAASDHSHEAALVAVRDTDDDETHVGTSLLSAQNTAHAREIGTAVHRILEFLDLEQDPTQACTRASEDVEVTLAELLTPGDVAPAAIEIRAWLERFANSRIMERLRTLRKHILGREVPLLVTSAERSAGAIVGQIDLLYRDPDTSALVVADYKTDRVPETSTLTTRAQEYAAQGKAYIDAVQRAFGMEEPPRFELWFLHHDRIVEAAPSK